MFFFFLGLFQGFFCLFFLVGRIFSFLMSSPESYKRRYYQVGSNEPSYSLDGNEVCVMKRRRETNKKNSFSRK